MLNNSYYMFVEVAAQRCSQLMRGAKPKIDLRAHKYSTIACAEVHEDLIPWETATDEQIAEELAAADLAEQEATEGEAVRAGLAGDTPMGPTAAARR